MDWMRVTLEHDKLEEKKNSEATALRLIYLFISGSGHQPNHGNQK